MSDVDPAPLSHAAKNERAAPPKTSRARRAIKRVLELAVLLLSIVFTILLVRAFDARAKPDLQPWHTVRLDSDFRASDARGDYSFADYLAQEERVLAEVHQKVYVGEHSDEALGLSRYAESSPNNPASFTLNWNRTRELEAPEPKGAALLIHGLTDSPYSLRRIGEIFHENGYYVLSPRLPGHGTIPGALTRMRLEDWTAAVRLAARHAGGKIAEGLPFVVVGHSNGGALAVQYALDALDTENLPRPTQLILSSPAIGVTPFARFSNSHRWLSFIPYFKKSKWKDIEPEYDPYKYNSFPLNAGEQTFRLTRDVRRKLARASAGGAIKDFPPTLTFQSLVDTTVLTSAIVDELYGAIDAAEHELVLFDVNREAALRPFLRDSPGAFLKDIIEQPERSHALTVIENRDDRSALVRAWSRSSSDAPPKTLDLDLAWPPMVYSLAHIAIPFSPEDPLYGDGEGQGAGYRTISLGRLQPRGERDLLSVSVERLMRLRYNPFFPYIEQRIRDLLTGELETPLPLSP